MLGSGGETDDTAAKTPGVGPLEEGLRWGEPSDLTSQSKSGTTIRIHWRSRRPEHCAMYVHCQTNLIEQCRLRHGDSLEFEGTRAVLFAVDQPFWADCNVKASSEHGRNRELAQKLWQVTEDIVARL